ncbi:MAG: hypothetical protein NT121_04350 [Chloroflexi bacterium]|nr:hypothetical protein [Chloroflexota bacterium]
MLNFKNLYHGIIQSVVSKRTDLSVILPEIRQPDSENYFIPEDIFPQGELVIRIKDDESVFESINDLVDNRQSTFLISPPMANIKHWPAEIRKHFPGYQSFESILLLKLVQKMKLESLVVALMPIRFLTGRSDQLARQQIFSIAHPIMIINHKFPWGELGIPIHHEFQVATVILCKKLNGDDPIKFFKIPDIDETLREETILSDFHRLLKQGGGQTEFGFVIRDRKQIGENWSFDYHHPAITKRKQELSVFGATSKLSDIFEIKKGWVHRTNDTKLFVENNSNEKDKGIICIEGRDLLSDHSVNLDTQYKIVDPPPIALIRPGDILIRAIHNFYNISRFPIVDISDKTPPAVASNSVIILRPINELSLPERTFILAYLRSDTFIEFLSVENSSFLMIPESLKNVPIPIPDGEMLTSLESLNLSISQFHAWIYEAELAQNALFASKSSSAETRLNTLSSGRLARQRLEAGQLVTDHNYRIRTQFPHPLAYHWRIIEAGSINSDGYKELLDAAEVAVCYLASVAIVATNSIPDGKIKYLETMSSRLCEIGHGTNMGDWTSILRETSSPKFLKKNELTISFYEIIQLLSDELLNSAVQRLNKMRNNLSHGKGPKNGKSLNKAFNIVRADLDILFRAMDFLTEYPLRYIETTRRDSIEKQTYYEYRELRGDHPYVPLREDVCSDPELEAGSLYLVDRRKNLYLVRPMLIRRECPECGAWATFFLDEYDKNLASPVMKSMEHGHTVAIPDLTNALKQIGLLK